VGHAFCDAIMRVVGTTLPTVRMYEEARKQQDASHASAAVKSPVLMGALSRKPDAAAFVHIGGDAFNVCSQRDVVMSFEFKGEVTVTRVRELLFDEAVREAVDEVIRDYAHTLPSALPMPTRDIPYGLAVIGDGVRWCLVRLSKEVGGLMVVEWSHAVSFALLGFDANDKTVVKSQFEEALAFFTLCVHALTLAASRKWCYRVSWDVPASLQVGGGSGVVLKEIVAVTASVVVRYTDAAGTARLAKVPLLSALAKVGPAESRFERECAMRLKIGSCDGVLPATLTVICGHNALVFDDNGAECVEAACVCDPQRAKALAKVVQRDIAPALRALHAKTFAFADVHPGNIVVTWDSSDAATRKPLKAFLIDCESVCAIGTNLANNRILQRQLFAPVHEATKEDASVEGDFESLRYVLAWLLNVKQFRELSTASDTTDQLQATKASIADVDINKAMA
jgi:hypothetical protein